MSVRAHGLSHAGTVREDNQDFIYQCDIDDPITTDYGYLFVIADGMGGYEQGGLASRLAVDTVRETFYKNVSGQPGNPQQAAKAFHTSIRDANTRICQTAMKQGIRMGSTLTGVHIHGDALTYAHVGDSRAYLIRNEQSTSLTQDHTVVGELVRAGLLSADRIRTHAQRSILKKCLGIDLFVQPDVDTVRLKPDDLIVLCTDGIWSVIQDAEFATLATETADLPTLSRKLLDLAMERESDDNVSTIVIHVRGANASAVKQTSRQNVVQQLFPFRRNRFSKYAVEL